MLLAADVAAFALNDWRGVVRMGGEITRAQDTCVRGQSAGRGSSFLRGSFWRKKDHNFLCANEESGTIEEDIKSDESEGNATRFLGKE